MPADITIHHFLREDCFPGCRPHSYSISATMIACVRPADGPPRMVERMEAFLALASAKQLTPM